MHEKDAFQDPRTAHLLTTLLLAPTPSHVTIVISAFILFYVAEIDLM